ncbi:hypothetical protein FACS1894204_01610 [Synergistales bacterium]|nr:hypothetical protein FACS1894204_01610 [Synergistales bacterium]
MYGVADQRWGKRMNIYLSIAKMNIIISSILMPSFALSIGFVLYIGFGLMIDIGSGLMIDRDISYFAAFCMCFLSASLPLLLTFLVSCYLRYKIFTRLLLRHKEILPSFLLIIILDYIFWKGIVKFTATFLPDFFLTKTCQYWLLHWGQIHLGKWIMLNYPMHYQVLRLK